MKRTTIEIDEQLLARAKRALGAKTTRATVEAALRCVAEAAEGAQGHRAVAQQDFLARLGTRVDLHVLAGDSMWR